MTIDANKYLEAYNSKLAGKVGQHYLKENEPEFQTVTWYYRAGEYKWKYIEKNAPIYIDITHDKPVTEETYVLHYDANGGEGAPASQTTKSNTGKATFNIPATTPTRQNYVFQGWSKTQDGVAAYQPNGSIEVTATNTTLYAVWEAKNPQPPLIPAPSYDDLKSAIGQIQVKDVSTPSCGTENYDLIDNTESEPFNWTKTARADQPGKYDVTIKTAPYVAKYNSEKTKTHELNNANQTTLKLVISYENNKWVLDDGLRVIEVKHSEQNPPTDIPNPNPGNIAESLKVKVVCTTTNSGHEPAFYSLIDGTFTHTDVDQSGDYPACSITISPDSYIRQYSTDKDCPHTTSDQPKTVPLFWNKEVQKWAVNERNISLNGVIFNAVCEAVPDTFTVTYTDGVEDEVIFEDWVTTGLKYGDATPVLGKGPTRRGYTFAGWEPEVAETVTKTVTYVAKWTPVEPKAPTADDLKKLDMAVQVKCVVDAAQQHTDAYGLLGEYDEDYFVGEPRKDGDDWLCDISYDPDLYVAEFNKAFPTPKHIQNDEKIVPVTLIWVGGSWQIKTQGRVHVTEVYTVTYTDGVDGEEVFADQVYSDLRKDSTTPAFNGTPTRTGYTFAGWEPEVAATVTQTVTYVAKWEAKKANVHLMIFKSGDLSKPIVDVPYAADKLAGDTIDLTKIDPSSYLDFDFEIDGGWYDDGLFNLYKKYVSGEQANKPAALTKLQITGNWQNLKLIVTELVPVVYFKSAEALAEYQNDHSKVENIIFTTKARVGSTLPTADAPTATRDGYTFTFWSREGQIGTDVTGQTVNGWTNLVANWEARTDTPYTVEHYLENLDGNYALDTTEHLKGTTDTTVTAAAKSYDNFTYDSTVPDTVASGNIAGDGSLVLKLFYTRNTYDYTVRHIKQLPDGSYDEANAEVETLSGKFEALAAVTAKDYGEHYPTNDADTKQNIKIEKGLTIDVKYDLDEHTLTFETNGGSAINPVTVRHGNAVARPADPTKDKYTFIGWYVDPEFTAKYDFATVLEADKTIYAKFELTSTPIGDIYVRYDVLHIKQLPDGTYDLANAEVEHLSAKKDTTVTAVIKDYRATHHVNVNRTLSKLTGTAIQPYMGVDGKPVYTILSVYYDLDFHTLTFDTMGGSKIAPETVRHGLTVAKPKDPVNGGYWFDGWYTDKTYRTPYNFATPLTQDTTIYAKWFLIVLPGVTVKKATPKLNTADHFAYVQGYPNGTVKPAGNITRAETAAILFRLMDDASRKTYYSTKSGFRDVASGSWYNTYVATLNNAGVITDSSNGYFRPNEAITRAELAAMLAKFSETTGAANYFNDVSAKYWAANAIAICAKLGWITGYPDGTFRPDKNVTRAELMAMINRATGRAPKSADAFLPGMKTWSDNTADKWYYLDVQEATNSHSYTVKGSETWTALTSDPNWSLYE